MWILSLALLVPSDDTDARIDAAIQAAASYRGGVYRDRVSPNWSEDGASMWYRVVTGPDGGEYVRVDLKTGGVERSPKAADLDLSAGPLVISRATKREVRPRRSRNGGPDTNLLFRNETDKPVEMVWVDSRGRETSYGAIEPGGTATQHTFVGHVFKLSDEDGVIAHVAGEPGPREVVIDGRPEGVVEPEKPTGGAKPRLPNSSPDGSRVLRFGREGVEVIEGGQTHDVAMPDLPDGELRGPVEWSPDGRYAVVRLIKDVPRHVVTVVDSSPEGRVQPKLLTYDYFKPGDTLPTVRPVLIDADAKTAALPPDDLFPDAFTPGPRLRGRWHADSAAYFFDYNQRGHQVYRILAIDPETAAVRTVVEEAFDTFVNYSDKSWRHWMDATDELLVMSEHYGWNHLYLINTTTGDVKSRVTDGPWVVREVLHVDEDKRQVLFLAGGLRSPANGGEEDPYHRHLCRVNFDGSGFARLTDGDGDHEVDLSPDRRFFVDRWSRTDKPPVTELRGGEDGSLIATLEEADAGELLSAGYRMPERFVAKGRDGTTDIHGFIVRPPDFDPAKTYPVIEYIYAGPHDQHVPKRFGHSGHVREMAALGFVVVRIDGMGTNHRGKAFHDVCWRNLKDAGFPDRKLWIKAAAETRPWMDLSRVGIYGGSAGGQNAMRALIDHPDFYHAAAADCGCHDNRMDKIWWNEQWMGNPASSAEAMAAYVASSNVEQADRLRGDLLLFVGELDRNVDPASTMQVVGALQKAGKRFQFMPLIGKGHGAAEGDYGRRTRMRFFLETLAP